MQRRVELSWLVLAAVLLSGACHGADPDWDMYALQSWKLADLPDPILTVEVVGKGAAAVLEVRLDAGIPCPIPLATAVVAHAGGILMGAVPGDKRGNGIGLSCSNPIFRLPVSQLAASDTMDIVLEDGNTRWAVSLSAPLTPRDVIPDRASVAPGQNIRVHVTPSTDRWIADPAGAMPSTLQLTSQQNDPQATCTREAAVPVPPTPSDPLEISVPADFCPGSAFIGLSSSSRRLAVLACPLQVSCYFEISGFVAEITILPTPDLPALP